MSKRCQMSKSQTHRLWRRFIKKINWHNEVHTYWGQFFDVPYDGHQKPSKLCIESVFEQTDDLCFGPPTATYSNGHSSENGQCGIFLNFCWTESDRLAPSCKFLGQNFEYPALQNFSNFSIHPKISKSWHLTAYKTANWWLIQKCKPRCLGHPRLHLWTDAWWNRSMLSTL